jgi:hypothetical protein
LFTKIFYTLLFILLPLSGAASYAQEMSPEKRELIKELLVVMEAKKNAGLILDSMTDQIQQDMLRTLEESAARDKSLTAAQRAERQRAAVAGAQRSADRFRELFNQRVNYSQVVEEISYEVYDKHLSTDDLKYMLAFYKSATGQKIIKIMPQLFAESMAKTSERLTPVVQAISQEIADEELKRTERASPVNKAPRRKRR